FTLIDEPLAQRLLASATGVIFPSPFLRNEYRQRFAFDGEIVEPPIPMTRKYEPAGRAIAYAGSVRRDKGGHFIAEIARHATVHVFGGGDRALLQPLRRLRNVAVHGYYRGGTLPSLLARHRIGLVVL